ncbi:MAG: carbohydrate ABC transporter permease [Armatimonadetes bacterium]|nr:carbohydrate ABC transporter permease [Armatimonadota bacterium]
MERFLVYILLALGSLVLAMPFYYMFVTSLRSNDDLAKPTLQLTMSNPTLQPYRDLLQGGSVVQATMNSLFVGLTTTLATLFFCTLAGYAFAKHRFPGRDLLFTVLLSTMMIPGAVLLVPGFLLLRDFGWLNTFLPLIVPGMAGAFGVFLSRQFISAIPESYLESARIEGAHDFRVYRSIILPLSKPLLATLGILTFLGSWNSFIGPLIVLLDERKYTLPLVIAMLQGRFPGKENIQMAGAMVSIAPVIILFMLFQKLIIQSLSSSGLKEG